MKYGEFTLGQIEALCNKLGGENTVRGILNGTMQVITKVISYITQKFTILVDDTQDLADAIAEGKFEWVNDNITQENFPKLEGGAKSERDTALFHFGKNMSSDNAIAQMDAEGYRPATIYELLAFARENPELQREFPIIALGSVALVYGRRYVAYLYRNGSERSLALGWFDDAWRGYYRFLAVRK